MSYNLDIEHVLCLHTLRSFGCLYNMRDHPAIHPIACYPSCCAGISTKTWPGCAASVRNSLSAISDVRTRAHCSGRHACTVSIVSVVRTRATDHHLGRVCRTMQYGPGNAAAPKFRKRPRAGAGLDALRCAAHHIWMRSQGRPHVRHNNDNGDACGCRMWNVLHIVSVRVVFGCVWYSF